MPSQTTKQFCGMVKHMINEEKKAGHTDYTDLHAARAKAKDLPGAAADLKIIDGIRGQENTHQAKLERIYNLRCK